MRARVQDSAAQSATERAVRLALGRIRLDHAVSVLQVGSGEVEVEVEGADEGELREG